MKKTVAILSSLILTIAILGANKSSAPLALVHSVVLKDFSGDLDHFAVDLKNQRLFLAGEDHGTVEVFSLHGGSRIRSIDGFEAPHSLFVMPEQNRLLVTDSGKGLSKILSADQFDVLSTINITPGADSIGYDRNAKHLYIVTGGKDVEMDHSFLTVVDPVDGKKIADVPFAARHVEAMALEQSGPRLFINVTDKNEVAVVDRSKHEIIAHWPVRDCEENSPVALDEANHRLFVVCRKPGTLVVMDTEKGNSVAHLPAPGRSDDVAFDAKRRRIYVPGGEGYIGVYQQNSPDSYEMIAKIPSAEGAKTCLFVPELDRLYVAVSPGETKNVAKVLTYAVR